MDERELEEDEHDEWPGHEQERPPDWFVDIGMEVHVQPRTLSKMFCGCAVAPLNAAPNTFVCEVCLGLPGVLPVMNRVAVEACLRTALVLNCEITWRTKFDRKNYMYPDLPKGYQISQYDLPIGRGGYLDVSGRRIRIRRVHLEEDTGKLVHAGDKLHLATESYVDFNRAGVPLIEIVTEPDLDSSRLAREFAIELRSVLRTIGASEAEMEKGQMRVEPNISVFRADARGDYGVKTELKNINSFRSVERAIRYEVGRQVGLLESGDTVIQETRGWSESEQRTFSQRGKEFAEDYRYFPEPDLPPLSLDRDWTESLRASLPELPGVRRMRMIEVFGLPASDAGLIAADRALADLFDGAVAAGGDAKQTANWIIGEVAPAGLAPTADQLAGVVKLVTSGTITREQGREVLIESIRTGQPPAIVVANRGFAQVSDASALEVIARRVIAANASVVADYQAGKKQALGPLMAELKKRAPAANPKVAHELLTRLGGMDEWGPNTLQVNDYISEAETLGPDELRLVGQLWRTQAVPHFTGKPDVNTNTAQALLAAQDAMRARAILNLMGPDVESRVPTASDDQLTKALRAGWAARDTITETADNSDARVAVGNMAAVVALRPWLPEPLVENALAPWVAVRPGWLDVDDAVERDN